MLQTQWKMQHNNVRFLPGTATFRSSNSSTSHNYHSIPFDEPCDNVTSVQSASVHTLNPLLYTLLKKHLGISLYFHWQQGPLVLEKLACSVEISCSYSALTLFIHHKGCGLFQVTPLYQRHLCSCTHAPPQVSKSGAGKAWEQG